MSDIYKSRYQYFYEVYLYSKPYFLHLENDIITEIDTEEVDSKYRKLIIKYNDLFLEYNLTQNPVTEYSVTIIIFNSKGDFLQQIDLHGDQLQSGKNYINFLFESVSNNNALVFN
jgi:hypothetical protein